MSHQLIDGSANNVLVVDDDLVQGSVISNLCSMIGYDATFVTSFETAAELIASTPFSCITVDLSLGERDGIELVRLIAALERVPRVIVVSGCEQRILNASVRMAHAAGIVDAICLPKPIDLTLLREALKQPRRTPGTLSQRSDPSKPAITSAQLLSALERNEIYPAFQPKVELSTGRVIGCEALARWDSAEFGSVGPDLFIPLAEGCGAIKEITLRILRSSIDMVQDFVRHDPTFVVAVNLSATLLSDPSLTDEVDRLLEAANVRAGSLMLEVTESTAMSDIPQAMDTLLRLRIKGIGVSMDDFGTGYSSLSALARMPFCELKIDRSFVKDCLVDADLWKMVANSVAIAHQYGMKVVAEGIEDADTWRALNGIGCDIGQGFAFSRALPLDAFVNWYDDWSQSSHDAGIGAAATSRKLKA